ncbi:YegP family protein [Thioalkalivibrio sp. HK1]|uniref:YegP family protein n=1 Tax=Thioalkalivibrio sp. HK1 TaxID=1469245 RepID=UPI00046E825B|nr:YegP family protein [Thioalkalivibrio sp. HK1]
MPGKFELYKDKAGEFRFRLKAVNGQNILASEGYKTRSSALKGIESVRKNSQDPARFESSTSDSGKKTFKLTAKNKQVIGTSQSYASDSGYKNGMKSVAKYAPDATLDDQTKS